MTIVRPPATVRSAHPIGSMTAKATNAEVEELQPNVHSVPGPETMTVEADPRVQAVVGADLRVVARLLVVAEEARAAAPRLHPENDRKARGRAILPAADFQSAGS